MIKRWLLFIIFIGLLSSCHFKLRGTEPLTQVFNPMALAFKNVPPEWKSILKRRLQLSHIEIVDSPAEARYLLTIQQEDIQRNIMSISSGSSSRQYQLIYQVVFSFQKMKGPIYISDAPILVTRFLTINNDRILGSHDEEEKIIHEMRLDAAIQLIYRLNALHPNE